MADLSFMSQLTDEQRQFAEVIRERARQMGIPPDLAVAIAYQESRLNPQPKDSPKGAIGIMQVRPIAARDVGVNPDDLRDPNVNIDAGLRYLKKALTETPDPRLAVVYYNAGPGTLQAFDQGGDLPQETEQYLRSLHSFGAFMPRAEPAAESSAEPAAEPPSGYELPPRVELQSSEQQQDTKNASERRLAEYVGLGAGATVSAYRAGKGMARGAVQSAGQALAQGMAAGAPGAAGAPPALPAAGAAPAGAPAATQSVVRVPGAPVGPADGGYMARGQTGAQVYNTAKSIGLTDIEAARALDTTKQEGGAHDLLTKRRKATLDIQRRFPSETWVERPEYGGLLAIDKGVGSGPRQSFVAAHPEVDPQAPPPKGPAPLQELPPRLPVSTSPPKLSGLQQVDQMLARMARTGLDSIIKPALMFGQRYISPIAGLAQGAGELVSAKQSMEQGDPLGAVLSGLGSAGAIASIATPAALPVAIGAPLTQAFRERMAENAKRFPADTRPPTSEEEEMASRPAFFYRTFGRRPAMRR